MDLTRQGFAAARTRDFATAARLYREAAELGNFYAQHLLGHLYEDGSLGSPDLNEAYRLYRLAADQGQPDSNHHVGMMHFSGKGAVQDRSQAIIFLRRSAELGYLPGKRVLGEIGLMSDGKGENAGLVNYLIEYAEAQPSAELFDAVASGYRFANGGLPFDFGRAALYTRRAEALAPNAGRQKSLEELDALAALQAVAGQPGRAAETLELAQYFESKSPAYKFLPEARKHYLQAAALGSPLGMVKAAQLLQNRDAGPVDPLLAASWRERGLTEAERTGQWLAVTEVGLQLLSEDQLPRGAALVCKAAQNGDRRADRLYKFIGIGSPFQPPPCPISAALSKRYAAENAAEKAAEDKQVRDMMRKLGERRNNETR